MKLIISLFLMLPLFTFAQGIPSFHIDFPQAAATDAAPITQSEIVEIRNILNNPQIGFVEITGLEKINNIEEKKSLFLLISSLLGKLIIQNPNKEELINLISDEHNQASFAHHNNAIPFHTDGAFLSHPPHLIGIWVEEVATSGGATVLINFYDMLCAELETKHAHSNILKSSIPFHVHDSYHKPNTPSYIMAPVISSSRIRYRSDLIMKGIAETSLKNKEELVAALDFLEKKISSHQKRTKFLMKKDCIYFFNNHYLLHNRESFKGSRKIWRTWMKERDS